MFKLNNLFTQPKLIRQVDFHVENPQRLQWSSESRDLFERTTKKLFQIHKLKGTNIGEVSPFNFVRMKIFHWQLRWFVLFGYGKNRELLLQLHWLSSSQNLSYFKNRETLLLSLITISKIFIFLWEIPPVCYNYKRKDRNLKKNLIACLLLRHIEKAKWIHM